MEKVTSKHGKGLSLEYTNISYPTDFDSCLVFSSKGHWVSLEFTPPIAFEFISGIFFLDTSRHE